MKKPSIDAIRKFKEQQERKKAEEAEKKIQEKLSTLEHRAAQGDRKAKAELKIIEKAKEERTKQLEQEIHFKKSVQNPKDSHKLRDEKSNGTSQKEQRKKSTLAETDFDELMRLAASNNNQIRRDEPKKQSPPPQKIPKKPRVQSNSLVRPRDLPPAPKPAIVPPPSALRQGQSATRVPPKTKLNEIHQKTVRREPPMLPSSSRLHKQQDLVRHQMMRPPVRPNPIRPISESYARSLQHNRNDDYYDDDEDDEYEDDYEQDGFVVDEDDSEVQRDEVRRTIKSVFGYDKRRCDLREAELDRQYRQIGRVSTFEDLEREERRASKLAAMEDARALREEEERKRLKRLRKKGY